MKKRALKSIKDNRKKLLINCVGLVFFTALLFMLTPFLKEPQKAPYTQGTIFERKGTQYVHNERNFKTGIDASTGDLIANFSSQKSGVSFHLLNHQVENISQGSSWNKNLINSQQVNVNAVNIKSITDPGTVFQYQIGEAEGKRGLKEFIVLTSSASPSSYQFELNLEGVKEYKKNKGGGWDFYNTSGKVSFSIPPGFMQDKKGSTSQNVSIDIAKKNGKDILTISADTRWVHDQARVFPVVIDPTTVAVVSGGIVDSETQFGGLQRKVVEAGSGRYYAFNNDAGHIYYKKSTDKGSTWGSNVDMDSGDTNNNNPTTFVYTNGSNVQTVYTAWIDTNTNTVEVQSISPDSSDALGTKCTSSSPGTLSSTYTVGMAVDSGGTIYLALADTTATGTVAKVYKLTFSGCSFTDITASSGIASGVTGGVNPVIDTTGTNAILIFKSSSANTQYNKYTGSWGTATNVDTNSLVNYSIVSDGTNNWLLGVKSTTDTYLYKYNGSTWSSKTAPWTGQTNISTVSLTWEGGGTLYASILHDASNQAYYKYYYPPDNTWSSEVSYGFTAGSLSQISSFYSISDTAPIANSYKIRQEINILDAVGGMGNPTINERVLLDTAKYSGTVTYYFEVTYSQGTAPPTTVSLRRDGTTTDDATVTPGTSSGVVAIYRTQFTPPAGQTKYQYYQSGVIGAGHAIAARIIILQNVGSALTSTETQIEIGNNETGKTNTGTPVALTSPKYWTYTATNWNGTETFSAEVTYKTSTTNLATIRLQEDDGSWNFSDKVTIVNGVSNTTATLAPRVVFTPTDGRHYRIAGFTNSGSYSIYNAKIIVDQTPTAQMTHAAATTGVVSPTTLDIYGGVGVSQSRAMQLSQSSSSFNLRYIKITGIFKSASPTDGLQAQIVNTLGGSILATSDTVGSGSISSSSGDIIFTFSTIPLLNASTTYYVQIVRTGLRDMVNYYSIQARASGGDNSFQNDNGSWGAADTSYVWSATAYGGGEPTKLEPQYLLLDTADSGSTGLQSYQQQWNASEWSGVTNVYKYSQDATNAADSSKLQDIDNSNADITNATVTGANQQIASTAFTMPTDGHQFDVNVTNTTGEVDAGRVLVATSLNSDLPGVSSAKYMGIVLRQGSNLEFGKFDPATGANQTTMLNTIGTTSDTHANSTLFGKLADIGINTNTGADNTLFGRVGSNTNTQQCSVTIGSSASWDVSVATYASKTKSVSAQDATPRQIVFSSDGLTMFMMGAANNTVFQYSLSTAWDVSTASYASKSYAPGQGETFSTSLFFKSDGTVMYIVGTNNDTVYEYSISSAWDLGSGGANVTYTGKNKSVTTQDGSPRGLFFKSDGTKMYVLGWSNKKVFPYSLSTAWDVSTATYDTGVSLSVNSEDTSPFNIFFKSDGTSMFMMGTTTPSVYQYTINTAWDLSGTTSYSGKFYSPAQENSAYGIAFSSDGSKMYIAGNQSGGEVYEYSIGAPQMTSASCSNETLFGVLRNSPHRAFLSQFGGDGSETYPGGTGAIQIDNGIHQYAGAVSVGDGSTATRVIPNANPGALFLFVKGSLTVTNAASINVIGFGNASGGCGGTGTTANACGGSGGGASGVNGANGANAATTLFGAGAAGSSNSIAGAGGGGGLGGTSTGTALAGGGGGGSGGNGGNGANAATAAVAGTAAPSYQTSRIFLGRSLLSPANNKVFLSYGAGGGGGAGGNRGSSGGGGGGGGGGGVLWIRTHSYTNNGTVSANGGAAGIAGVRNTGGSSAGFNGDGGNASANGSAGGAAVGNNGGGGGGGAGSGVLYIEADSVTINTGGNISAAGGNGGNGGNGTGTSVGGSGAAGGNGFLFIEIVP